MYKLPIFLGGGLLVIALMSMMIASAKSMVFSLNMGVLNILIMLGGGAILYGACSVDDPTTPKSTNGEKNEVDGNKTKL